MPIVLADLVPLVVFGVALALTIMCIALTKALFGVSGSVLGKLPVVGGWIDATGHHIEERITSVLGAVAVKLESGIGATWHMSARLVDWMGREINRNASLIQQIALQMPIVAPVVAITAAIADLWRMIHKQQQAIHGIGADVLPRQRQTERGIGADVLPRIRGLEREVNGEISRERVRARTAERTSDREITNLWKWTRAHTVEAGTLAFAGAVSLALSRLRLGWLRCESLGRLGRGIGCGGFGAIEDLLFGVVTAVAATDICAVADVAGGVARTIRPALMELVDVEDALVGCHGATRPPALGIAPLSLPPVRDPLPLAA